MLHIIPRKLNQQKPIQDKLKNIIANIFILSF